MASKHEGTVCVGSGILIITQPHKDFSIDASYMAVYVCLPALNDVSIIAIMVTKIFRLLSGCVFQAAQ